MDQTTIRKADHETNAQKTLTFKEMAIHLRGGMLISMVTSLKSKHSR